MNAVALDEQFVVVSSVVTGGAHACLAAGNSDPALRIAINPTLSWMAAAPPSRNPRDSMPATAVIDLARNGATMPDTTHANASASWKTRQTSAWPPRQRAQQRGPAGDDLSLLIYLHDR